MSACQVLMDEISRLKTLRSIWAPETPSNEENCLVVALKRGFGAMAMFSLDCPLIGQCCLTLPSCLTKFLPRLSTYKSSRYLLPNPPITNLLNYNWHKYLNRLLSQLEVQDPSLYFSSQRFQHPCSFISSALTCLYIPQNLNQHT